MPFKRSPVKPIRPQDVPERKKEQIPEPVIEAFNELIAQTFSNGRAVFRQEQVVQLIVAKMTPKLPDLVPQEIRSQIFEQHWLDVEDIYRKAGWTVKFDKPGFDESGYATFEFGSTLRR